MTTRSRPARSARPGSRPPPARSAPAAAGTSATLGGAPAIQPPDARDAAERVEEDADEGTPRSGRPEAPDRAEPEGQAHEADVVRGHVRADEKAGDPAGASTVKPPVHAGVGREGE